MPFFKIRQFCVKSVGALPKHTYQRIYAVFGGDSGVETLGCVCPSASFASRSSLSRITLSTAR